MMHFLFFLFLIKLISSQLNCPPVTLPDLSRTPRGCHWDTIHHRGCHQYKLHCQKDVDKMCFASLSIGFCTQRLYRWYFDKELGECRSFWYSGCGGNENRFATKLECSNKCQNNNENVVTCPDRPCSFGFECFNGECVVFGSQLDNKCINIRCPRFHTCRKGRCYSVQSACLKIICQDDQYCDQETLTCQSLAPVGNNLCLGVVCSHSSERCNRENGRCEGSCLGVQCGPGMVCQLGICIQTDKCAGVLCANAEFCNPETGRCIQKRDLCSKIRCFSGWFCDPKDGKCKQSNGKKPICPINSFWNPCGSECPESCEPIRNCVSTGCHPGCFCSAGFVLDNNGNCIRESECRSIVPGGLGDCREHRNCPICHGCVDNSCQFELSQCFRFG